MKHPIDPKVDCVFKALLGRPDNSNLLIHFLNALLADQLEAPIREVVIENPFNGKEFLTDKLSIVDVKARDERSRRFQIEIQLAVFIHLPSRMLYNWADLYRQQLGQGDGYSQLQPAWSIWLLDEALFAKSRGDRDYLHTFRMQDKSGRVLSDHCHITTVELSKFANETVHDDRERWLKFFVEGERLDDRTLPLWMQTKEMTQAMNTLTEFSDKQHRYHAYQARLDYLRQQRSIEEELEEARRAREAERRAREAERQAKEVERQAKEAERQAKEALIEEKEAALAEVERLRALLEGRDTES